MSKQFILAIGREYASMGHHVAAKLGEKLGVEVYDKNILKAIAEENHSDYEELEKYDEKPKNVWFSKKFGSFSSSIEEEMANLQFNYIKKKAEEGESFVIIGRCADEILKDNEGLVSVFVSADFTDRVKRVVEKENVSEHEAKNIIEKHDNKRKAYHDSFCEGDWGTADAYDLCINISNMSIDQAADLIINYMNIKLDM